MKKIFLQLSLFFAGTALFAQAPTNYYSTATGTEFTLKTQLYNIIKGHTTKSYDALKGLYRQTDSDNGFQDKYYEKDNTILDIYSEIAEGKDPYNTRCAF